MNSRIQKWYNLGLLDSPQASLIIPDFTISVYGSSCNSLFLVSFSLHAFSVYILAHWTDRQRKKKETGEKEKAAGSRSLAKCIKSRCKYLAN